MALLRTKGIAWSSSSFESANFYAEVNLVLLHTCSSYSKSIFWKWTTRGTITYSEQKNISMAAGTWQDCFTSLPLPCAQFSFLSWHKCQNKYKYQMSWAYSQEK